MQFQDPTIRETPWESSPRDVVRKLQFLLDTNHVTVMALAESTGITKKLVQDTLDGASLPTESMLRKFADFFGVSLEFIHGRDEGSMSKRGSAATPKRGSAATPKRGSGVTPKRGSGVTKAPSSTVRAAPGRGSVGSGKPGIVGAKRTKGSGSLNIRAVATRHQALVELLVEKGVVSARDYHEMVQKIESRGR